jgi:hypothetical protein
VLRISALYLPQKIQREVENKWWETLVYLGKDPFDIVYRYEGSACEFNGDQPARSLC